jgi:radical SAM superfamily enzyme YgiQ (UPF0313 family)
MAKYHGLIFSSRSAPTDRSSGAHRIATFLRQHDLDIEVVDFTPHWPLDELKQFVKQNVTSDTLFFGFSPFFSYWPDSMRKFVGWLKKRYPRIKTLIGGQNSLLIDEPNIDIWVDSYGEVAVLEVVKSLANNSSNTLGFDAAYFGQKNVIKALTRYPAYNLGDYSIKMEDRDFVEPFEWLTIEFARGCKFQCDFCNFPILGVKEDTSRSAESFETEMKRNYDKFGVTRYFVADETFNDRVEKIQKFANVVDSLDFETFYSGFIRADLMATKPEMIHELARMRFGGQYYGIETFNRDSGKTIGKGMDPDRVKQTLLDTKKYTQENGIYRGTISLIVGLPYDTKRNWKLTTNWLRKNWIDQGLVVFPLDVQDLSNAGHEYTNVSKFSKNLTKYGLREMPKEKYKFHIDDTINYNQSYALGNYSKKQFVWEHDTMNYFEAVKISNKVQNEFYVNGGLDNWQMSKPEMFAGHKIDNLADALSSTKSEMNTPRSIINRFLNNYIQRKLNKN